ncbi:RNA polymerase sigma factor [Phytoactinopolyspora mesophila]|uniref:Sigma-70 family RNA polymerase sigma factor n=1 Tax=Phytoactinopolyspora mesophila TaxID=2650750 RepID=A0A7K3M4S1_9ACTN|nr:sigma-70 family RNA polymerase sigma factor [Phytoactinopolyspora mesophila]NDL58246.1 sigma-70 family RNA polymerase sigma factor [Phytoactinopolyspora mesophila]
MTSHPGEDVAAALIDAHRRGWARVLASVARVTRDLDAAEDATQEAFAAALDAWRRDGVPATPVAWLTTVARRKALDVIRREETLSRKLPMLIVPEDDHTPAPSDDIDDDRLRLIFLCCHPALGLAARVALTLRLVCGLTTAEIAHLFLVNERTMAARITRAKKKIRAAGIPYRVPAEHELADRLPSVLTVVALVFTEGHTASHGDSLRRPTRVRLATELAAALLELMPEEPEVLGLLATIRLAEGRAHGRLSENGSLALLREQDRSTWDLGAINEGRALAEQAMRRSAHRGPGPYAIHAAIAALHSEALSYDATDWPQILALYNLLLSIQPSPVTRLARAMARSMVEGPAAALTEVELLEEDRELSAYNGLAAARADLLHRLGRQAEAAVAYERAASLTNNEVERLFLTDRAHAMRDRNSL